VLALGGIRPLEPQDDHADRRGHHDDGAPRPAEIEQQTREERSYIGGATFLARLMPANWRKQGERGRDEPDPREKDKLLVSVAAMVAERRLSRGVKLNYPEAVALITDYVLEGARGGDRTRAGHGRVPEMIGEIQVEATFPDGTKLVTVHEPIR